MKKIVAHTEKDGVYRARCLPLLVIADRWYIDAREVISHDGYMVPIRHSQHECPGDNCAVATDVARESA